MKQLFTIILLLSFAVCKAQEATYTAPFTLHAIDSNRKELGYFKYNPVTNVVTTRGITKWCFQFFVNEFFLPMMELKGALDMIAEEINDDGTVKDLNRLKAAMLLYKSVKNKYGM